MMLPCETMRGWMAANAASIRIIRISSASWLPIAQPAPRERAPPSASALLDTQRLASAERFGADRERQHGPQHDELEPRIDAHQVHCIAQGEQENGGERH